MLLKWQYFISSYGWVVFHCVCGPHLLYPIIYWRTPRLFPCLTTVYSAAWGPVCPGPRMQCSRARTRLQLWPWQLRKPATRSLNCYADFHLYCLVACAPYFLLVSTRCCVGTILCGNDLETIVMLPSFRADSCLLLLDILEHQKSGTTSVRLQGLGRFEASCKTCECVFPPDSLLF